MRTMKPAFLASLVLLLAWSAVAVAAQHGKAPEKQTGILLVAFGSSEESAQVSFENIDRKVKQAYPDVPVRWAYTSHVIRKKLAAQGKLLDSPEVALARMLDEGFTHVAVQSLHTISGAEFHDLQRSVAGFARMGGFAQVALGNPLLATQEDLARTVKAILAIVPEERKPEEAVVLMGHGTHHPANAFYAALMFQLQLRDPNIYIGTVEAFPDAAVILELLTAKGIKTAYLMPFMSVAGDHAKNDMAGDDQDSWKSIFTSAGITCIPILKGTAEFDEFVDVWVEHIGQTLAQF
ncbi:MAG: sirohydrochlorin cobaltochelatase [Desulfofustis sp.]|jgi:sirohydrochlorin cobaltochelatase|nr:sirohydrochlorin cobaltochelatase [Desulfofustis sp.]